MNFLSKISAATDERSAEIGLISRALYSAILEVLLVSDVLFALARTFDSRGTRGTFMRNRL